ncbi:septal ring lytic transglycosylase RlpA family protein [Stella sp.]|uniref:septal ring lytic transglycosylase RlpA family protein n=1 Tax=Stella sp. TaxID=2912054 RepID=UPI0035AE584B
MSGKGTRGRIAAAGLLALLVGACASTPPETAGPSTATKGSARGVYKVGNPYQIGGVWYYPKEDYEYRETGIASWYGPDFHGKATANGEVYDMNDLTAAHRTLPLPSVVRVTNLENGRSMTLRVNDRGPFARGRIIDVSRRGAQLLGFDRQGTAKVRVEIMAAESEQLAQIYRGSSTIGQALARTPGLPDPSAPMTMVAAVPTPAPPPPPPQPGADGTVLGQPILSPPPQSAAIEQVPLAPPAAAAAPRTATRPAAPTQAPVAVAASVDAPQPGTVTVEPVRRTQIFVQAGAFSQRANADRVRQTIGGVGPARVTTVEVSGAPVHRVRVGPLRSVEEADQTLTRIASAGYPEARIIVE